MAGTKISTLSQHTVPTSNDEVAIIDNSGSPVSKKLPIGVFLHDEYYSDGTLVYPYSADQTPAYSNELLSTLTCTYDGKTYTMTMNYVINTSRIEDIVVTDNITADIYTLTPTYDGSNNITGISDWVKT